jgi:hypothetical protein
MSLSPRAVLLLVAGVITAGAVATPSAQERAWPAFTLTRLGDPAPVSSASLVRDGQGTVLVIRPACAPCRAVLQRFSDPASPRLRAGQLAVVLSGMSAAEAAAVRASAPRLGAADWYVDSSGAAADALDAQGAPALLGVRGDRIAWTLRGSLYVDAQWQGVVLPWLR